MGMCITAIKAYHMHTAAALAHRSYTQATAMNLMLYLHAPSEFLLKGLPSEREHQELVHMHLEQVFLLIHAHTHRCRHLPKAREAAYFRRMKIHFNSGMLGVAVPLLQYHA